MKRIRDQARIVVNPPAIFGLGTAGGYEFFIQNRGDGGSKRLQEVLQQFLARANSDPQLGGAQTLWRATVPQLFVDVDREKAKQAGVAIDEVFAALSSTLGTYYVNDFNKYGRTWQVLMSAEPEYRKRPDDIEGLYVRSQKGEMVPLVALVKILTMDDDGTWQGKSVTKPSAPTSIPSPVCSPGRVSTYWAAVRRSRRALGAPILASACGRREFASGCRMGSRRWRNGGVEPYSGKPGRPENRNLSPQSFRSHPASRRLPYRPLLAAICSCSVRFAGFSGVRLTVQPDCSGGVSTRKRVASQPKAR